MNVPLGNEPSGVHPDETIERHLHDAPGVCLALAQRRFSFSGERTFLLCMLIFLPHAFHGPHQESKRGNHHRAARQAKVPEHFTNRRQYVLAIHAHQHRPMDTLMPATGWRPGITGDDRHVPTPVFFFDIIREGAFADQCRR